MGSVSNCRQQCGLSLKHMNPCNSFAFSNYYTPSHPQEKKNCCMSYHRCSPLTVVHRPIAAVCHNTMPMHMAMLYVLAVKQTQHSTETFAQQMSQNIKIR